MTSSWLQETPLSCGGAKEEKNRNHAINLLKLEFSARKLDFDCMLGEVSRVYDIWETCHCKALRGKFMVEMPVDKRIPLH